MCSYSLLFLKMVILELRYSGTEPSIILRQVRTHDLAYPYSEFMTLHIHINAVYSVLQCDWSTPAYVMHIYVCMLALRLPACQGST